MKKEIYLKNGDICCLGDFVIYEKKSDIFEPFIGHVFEIVQQVGSPNYFNHLADASPSACVARTAYCPQWYGQDWVQWWVAGFSSTSETLMLLSCRFFYSFVV